MTRHILPIALLAAAAIALAGCTTGPVASPSSSRTAGASRTASPTASAASATDIAVRTVTQEGLAIALASNVLQGQLLLVDAATSDGVEPGCQTLPGGGGHIVTNASGPDSARQVADTVYYDSACTRPYMNMTATVAISNGDSTATAKVDYVGASGAALGTMTTDAHADLGSGIDLEGLGTFTPAGGGTPVSLGLACQFVDDHHLNCQGGIAQDFSALRVAIGSITPLSLTIGDDLPDPITFTGSSNSTATGALGSLSIGSPDRTNLAIQGATPAAGSTTSTGQAHGFVPFPPTPTGWTVTDTAHDVAFKLDLVDDTSRALTGTVTRASTQQSLATLSLDQSGTGTITYAGQKAAPITSWLLTR